MSGPLVLVGALAGGLALGSIPWGVLLLRAAGRPDPRTVGSGNIGATNVTRAGGRGLGLATLLLDAGKGALAAWLFLKASPDAAAVAGLGAVIGHCFTPWLGFRGGKGVATFLGVALVLAWPWGAATFAIAWITTALLTRTIAVASLVATAACAFSGLQAGAVEPAEIALLGAWCIVTLRHRENFASLRRPTPEP